MELKDILAITGKPGLHKTIAHTKTGLIVESLVDKKRVPVYAADKITNMEDISIFTVDEDMPLKAVFKLIYEKENGGKTIDPKSDDKKLREYFEQILPAYDKDRVYTSDIKKVYNWYNLLLDNNLLDFSEPVVEEKPEKIKEEPKKEAAEPKAKKTAKPAEAKEKTDAPKKAVKAKKETVAEKKPTTKK